MVPCTSGCRGSARVRLSARARHLLKLRLAHGALRPGERVFWQMVIVIHDFNLVWPPAAPPPEHDIDIVGASTSRKARHHYARDFF